MCVSTHSKFEIIEFSLSVFQKYIKIMRLIFFGAKIEHQSSIDMGNTYGSYQILATERAGKTNC